MRQFFSRKHRLEGQGWVPVGGFGDIQDIFSSFLAHGERENTKEKNYPGNPTNKMLL